MTPLNPEQWQAISPYLEEALGMTDEQRSAWLVSLRTESPSIANLLETLLHEHQVLAKENFMENSSSSARLTTPGLAGQTLGAYTLRAQIGQGGMGSVWMAERSDGRFERRVAIKFLNIALVGKSGEERFRREGRILARLSHPHIADLIDAGISGVGQPYLVLEHIDGDHIDRYCDQHRLDIRARIRLFLDVLQAVAQAHANLIVHRDLKPSNVLVRNDGQIKLLDFGIAKLLEDETPGLTYDSGRAMTPEYASPEQLTGGAITTATDIYALGALLYVLLTGQHSAGNARRTAADLVKAIVDTEPARPSDVVDDTANADLVGPCAASRATTPDKLRRALRGDLDTILAKALKKEPAERYSSVTAFADDLRRYIQHQPISARPDTLAYRWTRFARRNQTAVAFAALTIAVTIAGVFGTLLQAHRARLERDFALHQLARVESISDLDNFLLTDAAPLGKPFTVEELLARAEHLVDRQSDPNPANRVELLISIGQKYESQDQIGKARRLLEQAYQLSRGFSDPSLRAQASCAFANVLPHRDLSRAEALVQEGLRELSGEAQFTLDRVSCLLTGSLIARDRSDPYEALARSQSAQHLLAESPLRSETLKLRGLIILAESYRVTGQYRNEIPIFEQTFALMRALGRDDTRYAGILFNNWALTFNLLGRPLEAEKLYRRSLEIYRTGAGAEQGVSPTLLFNYARTLRELARLDEAATYAERSYAKALEFDDQEVMSASLLLRAHIYCDQGNFARAEVMLSEAEPGLQKNFAPGHIIFAALAMESSRVAFSSGDLQSALHLANQALAIIEAWTKAGHGKNNFLPEALVLRSDIECRLGSANDAASDAARAVDVQKSDESDAPSSFRGHAYFTLGRALQAQGRLDDARAAFRSAAEHLLATLGPSHPDTRDAQRHAESAAQSR
jgi:eukaryotic-like serine/threonine-protein kinase